MKGYRGYLDKSWRTGQGKIDLVFKEEFGDFFGQKASTNPVYIIDSLMSPQEMKSADAEASRREREREKEGLQ